MSKETLNVSILNRNDIKTNWENTNPKLNQGEIGIDTTNKDFKIGDNTNNWKGLPYYLYGKPTNIRFYVTGSDSTAAVSTSPTQRAIWRGTVTEPISNLTTGMMITYKLDQAGNGTYANVLELKDSEGNIILDSTESTTSSYKGQHPVVYNVNSTIGSRYGIGAIINLVYDADQSGYCYVDGKSTLIKGCWKVNDYDSNDPNYQGRECYAKFYPGNAIKIYAWCLVNNNTIYAINSSPTTSTTKTSGFYTGTFDPFKLIYYLNYSGTVSSAASTTTPINTASLFYKYQLADLRYSFNGITTTSTSKFKAGDSVYLVAKPNADNTATLYYGTSGSDYAACLSKTLPTTEDGLIYIYLGQMYDYYRIELHLDHPIYWYRWSKIRFYTGKVINTEDLESDTLSTSNLNISASDGSKEDLLVIDGNTNSIENNFSNITLNNFKGGLLGTTDDGELAIDATEYLPKSEQLTAGTHITISNNKINATWPTKTSELTNDSKYISGTTSTVTASKATLGTAKTIGNANVGTAVSVVTGIGTTKFVTGISGGSGSLTSNTTASSGIGYIDSITYTSATSSGGGTVGINDGSVSFTQTYTASTQKLVLSLSYTPQQLTGTTTFVTGITPGSLTYTPKYLHHTHTAASASGSATPSTTTTNINPAVASTDTITPATFTDVTATKIS